MAELKRGGPLQGVRVVELTKVWAGPFTGKLLAYLGAHVIKIESHEALDLTRIYNIADVDHAPGFSAVNQQKMSVQINTKKKEGKELALSLMRQADVFVENVRPGAIDHMGLGYAAVKAVNPDIIYVSIGMYGNEGPLAYQTGYAPCFAALGGLAALVGYEGAPPQGMNTRYGDSTTGAAAAYAAIVALLHRRRTGEGQSVDVSAVETMASMVADAVMRFTLTGEVERASGNRHPEMAPHGVYRCRDDEWISIAAPSDEAWRALASAMEAPGLAHDPRFATRAARKAAEDALDAIISEWTATQEVASLVLTLQRRGIAAAKSQSSVDIVADPHLWERGLFPEVETSAGAIRPTAGPAWRMSRPARIVRGAPTVGEHNSYVLGELLGLSEDEQNRLKDTGVVR